jgi:hypothetical protein
MIEANSARVLELLTTTDRVLDIGGWALPFNRANYVLDIGDYDGRGMFGSQGPQEEHFTRETWIVRDLCDKTPYPFPDKYFDYVICSHTLEDIRDPVWVCSEINRIGKRGYIEVPSLLSELSRGVESRHYAGRNHHRWLIEIEGQTITFTFKYHHMHSDWGYHLPRKFYRTVEPSRHVQYLFWENAFEFSEQVLVTSDLVSDYLASRVGNYYSYPSYRAQLDILKRRVARLVRRST